MKLTHGSLFSGFGAPDLAAKWMGWDNSFHCEINEFCNTILEYWFPESKSYRDVTTTDFTEYRGKINILTGGFPCQPFSVAGQRKGADDNRYLWPHFRRVIREVQPDWVIGENVGGILTMVQPGEEVEVGCQASLFDEGNTETVLEQEFVIETICQDLECEGYSVQPIVIPACAVGAPHRRDRVWFIAHRADTGAENVRQERENEVLSDRVSSNADFCGFGKWKNEQKPVSGCERTPNDSTCCEDGITTHPDGERCNHRCNHRKERCFRYDWKRNAQEDKRERSEWKCGDCENGSASSVSQCRGGGQIHQEVQSKEPDGHCIDCNGGERDVANPDIKKLQKWFGTGRWQNPAKNRTGVDFGTERFGSLRYAPDPNHEGLSTFCFSGRNDTEKREDEKRCPMQYSGNDWRALQAEGWEDFPTQPPVCRGNDGLSFDVDQLAIPFTKWRQESVKGFGNAIVPQVIYEIFEAIEETYNTLQHVD